MGPVDKSDAPSMNRAEFKKLDAGSNHSFVTLAHHLRLVATTIQYVTCEDEAPMPHTHLLERRNNSFEASKN